MLFNTNHYIKVFMDTLHKSKKYAGDHAEAAKYYDVRTMDELAKLSDRAVFIGNIFL